MDTHTVRITPDRDESQPGFGSFRAAAPYAASVNSLWPEPWPSSGLYCLPRRPGQIIPVTPVSTSRTCHP